MRKIFISIIIVAMSFALSSQDLEHSWCLFPDYSEGVQTFANLIETDDGNYIVSMYDYSNYYKSKDDATIIKLNSDGVIINEIDVDIDDNYILNDIVLDVWNDTVNVFMHCIGENRDCAKMLHSHLMPDFTMTEYREIWSADFEKPMTSNIISCTPPLIDTNGIRTISYTYSSYYTSGEYPRYGKVIFLKLDSNCNVIVEKWIDCEDLNYDHLSTVCYTFNDDSTQYNVMCSLNDNPWHCQYVLDESFNVIDTVLFERESEMNYWGFFTPGLYSQNPNNGVIYGICSLAHPEALNEISVVKLDKTDMKVKILQCTDTPNDIYNQIGLGNYLCYSQNGDIYGMGIYDFDYLSHDPINYECKLYIVKFDENLNKLNEWYYEIEEKYSHYFDHIYCTESDDIIVTGVVARDYKVFPSIVKFPASAFLSIEEAHAHNLHLAVAYPNPGGDVMNIRTSLRNCTLHVYDMQGRMVHQQEITDDVTSVDASKWSSGTYIWKLTVNNEQLTVEEGKWVK
ncbi:MAG: T9SS type A sorting domain-containing protein [Bacteroidales bacterium]|nr:T9SS type A sorting domain-containing protein [Bacteroidales bacterium]